MKRFLLLTFFMCLLGNMLTTSLMAQDVVTIGNGTESKYLIPFETYQSKSSSQVIYLSSEIGKPDGGTIDKISYQIQKNAGITGRKIKVYMRNTTDTQFVRTSKFTNIVMTEADLVFDGQINLNANDWVTITLTNAFEYDGTNLLVSVFDYTNAKGGDTYFYQYLSFDENNSSYRCITKSGGSSDPTMSGQTFTSQKYSPNIQISITVAGASSPTAPDAPTLTSPANNATDIFNPALNFTLGANTDEYQIMLGTGTSMNAITGWTQGKSNANVSYQTHGLEYGKTYYWKVVARKAAGTDYISTESETYSFSTKNVTAAPEAISGIFPANDAEVTSDPNLSWTFGDNTEQYQVWFGFDREELYLEQDWTYTNNAATASFATNNIDLYKDQVYNENGLDANTTYNWKIVTKNGIGTTESDVFVFTKLGAPGNVTPRNPRNGATDVNNDVTLTWNFAANTTHYRVLFAEGTPDYLAYEAGGANSWLSVNGTNGSFATTDQNLKPNTTYYWCVDVKNDAGQRTRYQGGESVQVFSFTTTDVFPAKNNTPANGALVGNTTVDLTWLYQNGNTANEYQVLFGTDERSMDIIQDWTARGTVGTGLEGSGRYTVTDLAENTTYYWQVNVRKGTTIKYGEVWSFFSTLGTPKNIIVNQHLYPGSNTTHYTDLTWDNITEALYYNVYVDSVKKMVIATDNTYRVTGLRYNEGNSYQIQVSAVYNVNGEEKESELSEAVSVSVAGYASSISGVISNELSYEAIPGATVIYTGIDQFGNEAVYEFTTDNEGKFSGENILIGRYTMTVSKEHYNTNSTVRSFEYDEIYKNENMDLYPLIPDNVTDINPANNSTSQYNPVLSWTFAENTTHYRVLFSEDREELVYVAGNGTEWLVAETSTASFNTSNLSANTTYYWCVDVKNDNVSNGERAFYGEFERPEVFSFTTTDAIPVKNNTPANGALVGNTTADLTWNYGSGNNVTHYQVMIGLTEHKLGAITGWIERPSEGTGLKGSGNYTITDLDTNTKYYWRVDVKKGESGEVINGEVWSFVSTLDAPQNISANPVNVYPTIEHLYKKGVTTVSWNEITGASYNIYVNGEQQNTESITSTSYDVALGYNMEEGHQIQVTAVYEGLGESDKSEAANVKVTGFAQINGIVTDDNGIALEGATVTMVGTDEFEVEQEITFNVTDENGAYSGRVPAGKYNIVVSKAPYNEYISKQSVYDHETSTTHNVSLSADFIFNVSFKDVTAEQIHIYLSNDNWVIAKTGTYNVYFKEGENISEPIAAWFSEVSHGATAVYNTTSFNDIWFELENGTYEIGVEVPGTEHINWSYSIDRNYSIFTTAGSWNEESNWRGVPGTNADVYVYAAATISEEDDVTVKNVTIQKEGSLTINGSLTAVEANNDYGVSKLCINDGGQLRQTRNTELNGKFVMNIDNPTSWGETSDGWQFISSPVINAEISRFIPNNNYFDYDLYKYDGTKVGAEWVNQKQTDEEIEAELPNDFESTFVQYRGYLASYESDPMGEMESKATFSGKLNNATSFNSISLAYNEEIDLANFHLFGNPFTFNMDLNNIISDGIIEGFAVINEEGNGYKYLTEGEIKVGQGFFMKTKNENATISYIEGTKSRNNIASLNIIASNKTSSDNVIIRLAGAEDDGFNKLENFDKELAEIYLSDKGKRYGIKSYDKNVEEVTVHFIAKEMGFYTINAIAEGDFDNVILIDRLTGDETDLLADSYSFTTLGNERSDRFIVKFSTKLSQDNERFAYQSGDELIINAEGDVQIIDMTGRMIFSGNVENSNGKINISNLNNAAYIVRVISENEVKVQKVIIY